ncbi:sigma-54-dependent Fis family transcriptional regulator [bacterium]|nr:sigma-54-dependent Fis family transcriptional regulator [bacterium]
MKSVVLLSRRHRLYAAAADWDLPDVELYLFDSPSEALARISLGQTAVFLFDTRDYPRFKHVVRKFLSMNADADLVVVGPDECAAELAAIEPDFSPTVLPAETDTEEIRQVVGRALRLRQVRERSGIVGRSRAVVEMLALVAHAAPLDVNVLILGESGTGKELVARAIHDNSARADGPFISLNCGAMSEGVLESELFGHAKGAFTGAVADHDGVFRRADGGTLFLDEVAEMPLGMQTRFLRALETGEFTPVGGRAVQTSDIRLVAATHRDLAEDVARGRFRQDLYYRLKVVVVRTPALRDRRDDIPLLTQAFLGQENARHGLHVKGLTRAAEQIFAEHDWPGNVRELRNTISSLVVMKQRGLIEPADLPAELRFGRDGGRPPFLPVPAPRPDAGGLDLGVLAGTLLELRQDIKEIKALLAEAPWVRDDRGWNVAGPVRPGGPVVETFGADDSYGPLQDAQVGDLQTAERTLIEAALLAAGGNRRKAADRLGISERTLYRKIKLYDL